MRKILHTDVLILLVSWTCMVVQVFGQQTPQYTMNMLDKYNHNPAYGGMDRSLNITGAIKSQWEGFPGAPKYQYINAHLPLYIINGGAGIKFFHDAIGPEESVGFQASFNYVYDTDVGLFSVGLSAGIVQKKLDGSLLRTPDGVYEGLTIVHNDPILSSTNGAGIAPTATLGVYFANEYFEAGVAIDQVLGNQVTLSNVEETTFTLKRVFNAFVEYRYPVDEEISLYPSIFTKSDGVQTQLDFSARIEYQDLYFGGLLFRGYNANSVDAIGIFAGARINNNLRVSYGYDITLSALQSFSEGTHEFVVQYNLHKPLGIGRPERIIYNPRY